VLSVAKLTLGQEGYYQRSVAQGLDDYYAGRGESSGIWTGRGAEDLGLAGVVHDGQLADLAKCLHPATGERLRRPPRPRTITIERINPFSDQRRIEQKKLAPVSGFDLVFSAPKSVSLLHALGDERTRRAVSEAHIDAWQAALTYLEDEACVTRRGRNGVIREHARGFVAAAYQHRTSRAQDPQLHTHVIVGNLAQSPDGKWRALDGEAILKTYRLAAGYLYQAHLRAALRRSLGVEWRDPVKGMAEIKGVPAQVLAAFSQRRAQVVDYMDGHGTAGFYASKVAAVETRERKEEVDLVALRDDWRARALDLGFGQTEIAALLDRAPVAEHDSRDLLRIANTMVGPTGLTERRTAFSTPELVMAWVEALSQGADADRIRELSARLVRLEGVREVGAAPSPGRPGRYSTTELISVERAALALVGRGLATGAPTATTETLDRVLAARPADHALSPDQLAMVRAATQSTDRVVNVVGLAGSGKTTAVHTVAEAFAIEGAPIIGAAPSGAAAQRLGDETGIPSTTLHRLLTSESLPHGCVLVIDEAGMAETRVLAPVLTMVERAGGKAVLVGDPHQLPAVGAGGLFAAIVERHGAVELTENRRQHDPMERKVLARLRKGFGRDYLAYAEKEGRFVVSDDPVTMRARLLADWWEHSRHDLSGNVMIALRRRDVNELNVLARTLLKTDGRLGGERVEAAGLEFAAGDRVVCRRNSDALAVRNGTRGTIEAVDPEARAITLVTDRGDRTTLPAGYLDAGHVRHGYAITGHAGQGLTVDRAFVLGSADGRLQEWGYVAFSRARDATTVYITSTTALGDGHARALDGRDATTRFAAALEESSIEHLASDQQPLPGGLPGGLRGVVSATVERAEPDDEFRRQHRELVRECRALSSLRSAAGDRTPRDHEDVSLGIVQ
jgi:conjugative relaxase-like TrwC/TraI family protein